MTKTIPCNNTLYIYSALSPSRCIFVSLSHALPSVKYKAAISSKSVNMYHNHPEAQPIGLVASGSHKVAEVLYWHIYKVRKAIYGRESSKTYDDMLRRVLLLLLGNKVEEEEEEEEEEGSLSAFNPSQNRDEALQRRVEKLQR
jgi:hypothetical protein